MRDRSLAAMGSRFLIALLLLRLLSFADAKHVYYLDTGECLLAERLPASTGQMLVLKSELLGQLRVATDRVVKIEMAQAIGENATVIDVASSATPLQPSQAANARPPVVTAVAVKPVLTIKPVVSSTSEIDTAVLRQYWALPAAKKWLGNLSKLKTPNSWRGKLRIGLNMSVGDRKWTENNLRGELEIKPAGGANFYRISGRYIYRKTEKANGDVVKSTDLYEGELLYRRKFLSDWFVQNTLNARVNQVKGIDRDLTGLFGLGYQYRSTPRFDWLLGSGAGLRSLQARSLDNYLGESPVVNVFQEFNWNISKRLRLSQNFRYNINPQLSEQYNYILSSRISFRFSDLLGFEFSYNKNYDNDVGNGEPKEDVRWQNALVVYF